MPGRFQWFLRFAHKGGQLTVSPHLDVIVRRNDERRTEFQVAQAKKNVVGTSQNMAARIGLGSVLLKTTWR